MKNKLLATAAATAIAGLVVNACGSPCEDLADRICNCQSTTSAQDSCKSAVSSQISHGTQKADQSDQDYCNALLSECEAPDGGDFCYWIKTNAGKEACGVAYQIDGGTEDAGSHITATDAGTDAGTGDDAGTTDAG